MPPKLRRPRMADAKKAGGEKKQSATTPAGANKVPSTGTAANAVDTPSEPAVKASPKKSEPASKPGNEKSNENVVVNGPEGPEEAEEGKKESDRVVFQVKRSSKVEQASNVFDGKSAEGAATTEPDDDDAEMKSKGPLEEAAKNNEISSQEVKIDSSNDIAEDCIKVVNLNGETVDWPKEFVQYTTTTPSIAFGCNPFVEDFDASDLDKPALDDVEMKGAKKSPPFLPRSLKMKSGDNQGQKSNDESAATAEGCETKKQRKKKKKGKRKKKKRSKEEKLAEEGAEADGKDKEGQKVVDGAEVEEVEGDKKKKKKRKKKEKSKKRKSKSKAEEGDDAPKDAKTAADQKGKHKKHKKRRHKEKKSKGEEKLSEKKSDEKETVLPKTEENASETAVDAQVTNTDSATTPANNAPAANPPACPNPAASDSSAPDKEHGQKGKKHTKRTRDHSVSNSSATADTKETSHTPVSSKRRRRHSSKRDLTEADSSSAKEGASKSEKKSEKPASATTATAAAASNPGTRKSAPGALISGHSLVAYSSDEDSNSQPKEEVEDSKKAGKEKQIKSEPHLSWDTPERESRASENVRGEPSLAKPVKVTQPLAEVKVTGKSSWDTSDSEVEGPTRVPGPGSATTVPLVSPKTEKGEAVARTGDNATTGNAKPEEKTEEAGRRRRKRKRTSRSSDSSRASRSSDGSYSRSRTRSRSHRRRRRRRGGGRGRAGRRNSRYRRRSRSSSYSSYSSRSSRSPSTRSYSRSFSRSSRSYSSYTSSSSYSRSGRSHSRSRSSYSSYSSRTYYSSRSRSRSRSSSYRHGAARGRSRRRRYSSKSSPDPRYSSVLSNRRIRQGPNRQVSSAANASVSVGKAGDIADGPSQQKQLLNRLRRARDSATSNAVSSNATAVTAAVANSTPNNNSDSVDVDEDNEKPVFGPHLPDAGSKSGNDDCRKKDSGDSGAQPSLDIPLPKDRPKLHKPGPGEWCPAMDFGGPPKKKKKTTKSQNQQSGSAGNGGNSSSGAQDIPLPGGPTYIGPQVPVTMAKSLGLDISGVDSKQGSKPQYTTVSATCSTMSSKTSKKSATPHTSNAGDESSSKKTIEDSFFIPPDQAEQYKALQHQAKIHAAKQTGEPLPPDVEATVSISQIPQAGTPTLSVAATPTQALLAQSDLATAALLQQQQQQQQHAQIAAMLNAAIQQQHQQQQQQQQAQQHQALLAALSQQSFAQAAVGAQHLVPIPQMFHQGATPLLAKLPQAASGLFHTPAGLVGLHHGLPQAAHAGLIPTSVSLTPSGQLVATPGHHMIHSANPLAGNQLTALQAAANPSLLAALNASHGSAASHSVGAHVMLPTGQIVRLVKPM